MDAEERAALERELAADLAALDDEGFGEEDDDSDDYSHGDDDDVNGDGHDSKHSENVDDPDEFVYKRLDVDDMLGQLAHQPWRASQLAASNECASITTSTAWTELMATVAKSDVEVFQSITMEMAELQAEMRQVRSDESCTDTAAPAEVNIDACIVGTKSTLNLSKDVAAASAIVVDGSPVGGEKPQRTAFPGEVTHEGPSSLDPLLHRVSISTQPIVSAVVDAVDHGPSTQLLPTNAVQVSAKQGLIAVKNMAASLTLTSVQPSVEMQREQIEARHAQRELVRLRAQQQAEQTQRQLDAWIREQNEQFAAEQMQHEQECLARKREQQELHSMKQEEVLTILLLAWQREQCEIALLEMGDLESRALAASFAAEKRREEQELQHMTLEEVRERRRCRREIEDALREEHMRRRRIWVSCVLRELVETLALQAQQRRQQEDVERRRAMHERGEMRSEELWMRRVLAIESAVQRQTERDSMEKEEVYSRRVIEQEEKQRRSIQIKEEEELKCMQREEEDCHQRQSAIQRIQLLSLKRCTERRFTREKRKWWERWLMQSRRAKEDEISRQKRVQALQRIRRQVAIRQIQQTVLRWWSCRQIQKEEDQEGDSDAALRLQSAFRGFHVRRRFQSALAMANRLAHERLDDDDLAEVHLNDLIELPPELEDDWETPVMQFADTPALGLCDDTDDPSEEEEEEGSDVELDEDENREEKIRLQIAQKEEDRPPRANGQEPGGGGLAAALWGRMRRQKKKQEHVLAERRRSQDPTYRAQKVLKKPVPTQPTSTGANNNNGNSRSNPAATISWSTTSDPNRKKTPKVKLPSLVERLRKKTASAHA